MCHRFWGDRKLARYACSVTLLAAFSTTGLADDGDALAIVNGHPIARRQVLDLLLETHGLQIMQQVIVLELAQQETRRRGLEVTEADVQAQFQRALDEIAPGRDAAGVPLTDDNKRQALELSLRERCLTMPEFRLAMERNAHLRKLVEQDFRVDEPTLREEFARTYGEKVEVRRITFKAGETAALHEAVDRLNRGEDFAALAQKLSTDAETASRGGLSEPFTFTDTQIPAAIRDVAFSLKPGEVSTPALVGSVVHILKLERRIPPVDVRFEDVRAAVEARLRERVVRQKMTERITTLFDQAKIRVLDPQLKREFDELLKQRSPNKPPVP